jgi:hypothetical protein
MSKIAKIGGFSTKNSRADKALQPGNPEKTPPEFRFFEKPEKMTFFDIFRHFSEISEKFLKILQNPTWGRGYKIYQKFSFFFFRHFSRFLGVQNL